METIISSEMLVASRAVLGWNQDQAAKWAGVGVATIKRAETDPVAHARAADKLLIAYRTAGVTIVVDDKTITMTVDRAAADRARAMVDGRAVVL